MKFVMMFFAALLVSVSASANWESLYFDGEDTIQGVRENRNFKKKYVTEKLAVDYWSQIAAVHSDPETFECADEHIKKIKAISPSGIVFYMLYTVEDYCDGGNSIGIILDEQLKTIGKIEDSTFYKN